MELNDLIAMVTEGLTPEQAASVRSAIERDNVKSKVSTLKAKSEYEALVQREQELNAALEGGPDKPGAKAYQRWYDENFAKVQQLQQERTAYEAKFGKLDATPIPQTQPTLPGMSKEDIQREIDARIQSQYAPRWSDLMVGFGKVVQKHMYAKRTNPIDMDALSKLAQETRFNGSLEAAYDEWDKPEREKNDKEAREAEIKRRVDEELQRRGASQQFPAGADFTPSALSTRTKAEVDKFDPAALRQDLARTFITGVYPGENVQ